jgi:hypothetical protein
MLPVVNWADSRLQPLAYVTDAKPGKRGRLFEVLEADRQKGLLLENCRDGMLLRVGPREICPGWRLVRAAPTEGPKMFDDAAMA